MKKHNELSCEHLAKEYISYRAYLEEKAKDNFKKCFEEEIEIDEELIEEIEKTKAKTKPKNPFLYY